MNNQPVMTRDFHPFKGLICRASWRAAGALALAFCLCGAVHAGQEQQPQDQQQESSQDAKAKPAYASQDGDKPPYSQDRAMQDASVARPSPDGQAVRTAQPVPETLIVPAGTIVVVRINEFLSSDRNQIGDQFTAELEQPIVVNGWVVARRGQVQMGQVKAAQRAGRVKGVSQLGVELTDMTVVDGRQVPILTELWKASGGTSHGEDATAVVGGTGFGALIGAAAGWGKGAAIGAGAGAAAGIAAVLLTRGRPTELPPETALSFRVVDPVRIDTMQGQQAFLPVSQEDFEGGRQGRRGPRLAADGYPGRAYPCGYYAPCYAYPGYVGFYDGYGWGPRYYGGFYGRRGFRH